jgi:hypothetical protein
MSREGKQRPPAEMTDKELAAAMSRITARLAELNREVIPLYVRRRRLLEEQGKRGNMKHDRDT